MIRFKRALPLFCYAIVVVQLASTIGCAQRDSSPWLSDEKVLQLPESTRREIEHILAEYCGTPADPKLIGNPNISREHLLRGEAVYNRHCAQCHGPNGDGAGTAANYFNPPPTDFRRGVFKFTSTPYGAKPVRADLVRTVREGCMGTAMPSFSLLKEDDLQAVIDYLQVLAHRGELEEMLLAEATSDDAIDPANVPEYVQRIVDRWSAAAGQIVTPISPMVPYGEESVKLGENAFRTEIAGCYKCHGNDGRGREIPNAALPGAPPFRAADLTSGMLRGGFRPIDIYRRIYSGINGTAMPSYSLLFKDQPEMIWHLVHYVEYLSGTRRRELKRFEAIYQSRVDCPDCSASSAGTANQQAGIARP